MPDRRSRSGREYRNTSSGGGYCRGAGPYPVDLRPVALRGDYVQLLPSGDVYAVDMFMPQAGVKVFQDAVNISANGEERDVKATELELDKGWLGQFRMVNPGQDLPVDVNVTVDHGGENKPLYTTKNARGEFDRTAGTEVGHDGSSEQVGDDILTHFLEYYVFEDEVPFFTFDETGGAAATVQDVEFRGYQYRLEPANAPSDATPIPLPTQKVD